MGKSMSTAKQINQNVITKVAKEATVDLPPNQQIVRTGNLFPLKLTK